MYQMVKWTHRFVQDYIGLFNEIHMRQYHSAILAMHWKGCHSLVLVVHHCSLLHGKVADKDYTNNGLGDLAVF